VKAKADALQTLREQQQRDRFLGEAMTGHGASLSLAGRMDEAKQRLDEALAFARELDNPQLIALALRVQADRERLAGDLARARTLADEAVLASSKAADRALSLQAQATLAFVESSAEATAAVAARLRQISQQAETIGLRPLAVECLVRRAETLLVLKDHAEARQEADRVLARAEPAGFRLLAARAHIVRGEALRAAKDASARRSYQAAIRILDQIKAEEGNQDILKRADLGPLYADAVRWAK
jgi:hypothetical protein